MTTTETPRQFSFSNQNQNDGMIKRARERRKKWEREREWPIWIMIILVLIRSIYMQMFIAQTKLKMFINFMEIFSFFFRFLFDCSKREIKWNFFSVCARACIQLLTNDFPLSRCWDARIFHADPLSTEFEIHCMRQCICCCISSWRWWKLALQ